MDNGVLRFDHVRIPRDQMLMRGSCLYCWAQVCDNICHSFVLMKQHWNIQNLHCLAWRGVNFPSLLPGVRVRRGFRRHEVKLARDLGFFLSMKVMGALLSKDNPNNECSPFYVAAFILKNG
ncbi:uncharacterized protein LOC123425315 isoform X2 [Hordeum vulgare subsp. vulgare]|uniref:uncharacterized protein LOC123425315 isoform X2 n=1 Tax=Hordeum vulgare subsp. vulgare TaxID=112509 RepID=UPI00162B8E3A|nr:uncharacterized protein LOC123425315 isoform X2 [Hordeum vulgare subsp. vulgare]